MHHPVVCFVIVLEKSVHEGKCSLLPPVWKGSKYVSPSFFIGEGVSVFLFCFAFSHLCANKGQIFVPSTRPEWCTETRISPSDAGHCHGAVMQCMRLWSLAWLSEGASCPALLTVSMFALRSSSVKRFSRTFCGFWAPTFCQDRAGMVYKEGEEEWGSLLTHNHALIAWYEWILPLRRALIKIP